MAVTPDSRYVFNVVVTGDVFSRLCFFVCSLMDESDARFRLVANACTAETLELLHELAQVRRDRVVEVFDVSRTKMIHHGHALDAVYEVRDDGEFFCFVDADIKARGPFLAEFEEQLSRHAAVTSGKGVWTDESTVPPGHAGVAGEHFYDQHGFVYGSPHFAMYHRSALDETRSRWDVGFGAAGPDVPEPARARLAEVGHLYKLYDTAKVVNILLQADGHSLCHLEHPQLLHIGGMSHYLSPPKGHAASGQDGEEEPNWARWKGMAPRFEVTRFSAAILGSLTDGLPAPEVPDGLEPSMAERLRIVRAEIVDLVETHRSCLERSSVRAARPGHDPSP